jgi:hypothetical protein
LTARINAISQLANLEIAYMEATKGKSTWSSARADEQYEKSIAALRAILAGDLEDVS